MMQYDIVCATVEVQREFQTRQLAILHTFSLAAWAAKRDVTSNLHIHKK